MSKLLASWQQSTILEAVLDQHTDALILFDAAMLITGVNRSAEAVLEMSAADIVGRRYQDVVRCARCDGDCGIRIGCQQETVTTRTIRFVTAGRPERMAVIRTTHFYSDRGDLTGAVATVKVVAEEPPPANQEMVAESPASRDLLKFVRRVAGSEASTVLIEGENGTGKDVIARTIHFSSKRRARPFVTINCAAIPETLLESELFGYEKGAFTDARSQKRGLFELADKGTLFLDEVGEIPLMLQVKMLRVLEEQTFRRLGGLKDIQLDLRVVAATNRNMREAVESGAFRQDLYFRLNVIHIQVPPLRARREDILPLARHFLRLYNHKFQRQILGIAPDAERALLQHDWPGNVREVRNAVEHAMILEDSAYLTAGSLPSFIEPAAEAALLPLTNRVSPNEDFSMADAERALLIRALRRTNGNQSRAAQLLGVTRDKLRYRLKKFGLRESAWTR